MFSDLSILDMARAMGRHATTRHGVIAENVANADTPGYSARDLTPFSDVYRAEDELKETRAGHAATSSQSDYSRHIREEAPLGAESPNGNTVSLEDQMMRAGRARRDHEMATAIYGKALDLMRLGIGSKR